MQPDGFTFLSYGLIGYLMAPVVVLLLISLDKESEYEQPVRGILWFAVAIMALCAVVILFTILHRILHWRKSLIVSKHYHGKLNE